MRNLSLTALLLLLLSACHPKTASNPETAVVSVSILPQHYFIERLAGDLVEVNVMIPPGASPATYEPTLSQLNSLRQSDLYLRIGHIGFELSWMEKILSVNPGMRVVDLSKGIALIEGTGDDQEHGHGHRHRGTNPHVWMSARNAGVIATNMHEALCSLLPGEKEVLSSNLATLLLELDSLDQAISEIVSGMDHRSFMIYHPSLSYFARDYQLEQLPLEVEGKTPSPAHMKQMSDLGKRHHISAIFVQKQFDQKNAEALAREIGAKIVQIDPLDYNWHSQMLFIATQLSRSL
ncbi:MAG: zinc ABC transporter substrate-binding protein [Bacteroidota bacterium]